MLSEKLTNKEKMRTIKSQNLELFVEECDKIVLNNADNKRYIEEGVIETLAFGHHKIPHSLPKSRLPKILDDPTLSMEEKEFIVSNETRIQKFRCKRNCSRSWFSKLR